MPAPRPGLVLLIVLCSMPLGADTAELVASARRGDLARVAGLLRGGADPDARDRAAGTALDVAEKEGLEEMAALLRAHGARGSGKSVGDTVCVTPWAGSGFCAKVASRRGNLHHLTVLWLEGCGAGCEPEEQCSARRPVGGTSSNAIRVGDDVSVPSWCLTRTAVAPRP
jgi:hypothetical protein